LVATAISFEILEKEVQIVHLHQKRFHSAKKNREIIPVDSEIIVLRTIIKKARKKEMNISKKYVARSASLLSWLKYMIIQCIINVHTCKHRLYHT